MILLPIRPSIWSVWMDILTKSKTNNNHIDIVVIEDKYIIHLQWLPTQYTMF